jgi:TorA maturation chaperone TorD
MELQSYSHNILKGYNMLLYFAGSLVMYEPKEECIVDFWQQGILTKLPVSSSNPNYAKAASQLRESCTDKVQCLKNLRDDYFKLFDGHGLPFAPAYESLYNNHAAEGMKNLAVSDFYYSYGWISKYKGRISDDHLAVELLFLTILVEKYLTIDDQVCLVEIRSEIRRFIDQHLFSWLGKWNEKVQEHAGSLCYKGIATLIYACVEDIYALCDNNQSVSINSPFPKN